MEDAFHDRKTEGGFYPRSKLPVAENDFLEKMLYHKDHEVSRRNPAERASGEIARDKT
jgi:hypothetical protein